MSQIGAFRSLTSDRAKLRDHRMSWVLSKGRAAIFLSKIGAEISSQMSKCANSVQAGTNKI